MKDYDVLIPVETKTALTRILWVLGCLISFTFLLLSFYFKNGVLVILDGVLPIIFMVYKLISKKHFPVYYWLICVSVIYPLYWFVIDSPDYDLNLIASESNFTLFDLTVTFISIIILVIFLNFVCGNFIFKKLGQVSTNIILFFVIVSIPFIEFLALNYHLDKPYKSEQVYVTDSYRDYYYYKFSPEDDKTYKITDNGFYLIKFINIDSESEMEIITIEYGKGAFGIEWHEVVH